MNYPIWEIPILGGSWLIGIMACIHIFISHFAVGGGLYFALSEWLAYKNNDEAMYDYLKKHAKFFMLVTTVAGAVTGVGIWTVIALVSPDGLHTLIQVYTFGWACEYLFFVAELAVVFVYYYCWDRVSRKTHLQLAISYAIASILTLVIINGILTFMLTPDNWIKSGYWLEGFFNRTYWPSLFIRIVIMASMAGMYSLYTASKLPQTTEEEACFRDRMLKYAAKWFIPTFAVGPVLAWWFSLNIPPDVLHTIQNGMQTSGVGNFSILARASYLGLILSGTVIIFAFVGPYLNPRGFTPKMALAFMVCGLLVTSIGEWSREMLRKPYVIYGHLYSNGLRMSDIETMNQTGYIANSKWKPQLIVGDEIGNKMRIGKAMFEGQCLACHTKGGYRSMPNMLGERDDKAIVAFLTTIHNTDKTKNPYMGIMPPVAGTSEEVDALATYLATLRATPKSMQ